MDAYQTNVPQQGDTAFPIFQIKAVEQIHESKLQGRPVFKDCEFVEIVIPGSKDRSVQKVRPEHIQRWPEHYKRFKNGNNTQLVTGTPIVQWNGITPSQAAACKANNVFSVESLANLPDVALRKLGPDCYQLQERAKSFLAGATTASRVADLEKKLADALAEIEKLKTPVSPEVTVETEKVVPIKAVSVTGPDGKTWSGRGRKPQWVKDME